MIWAFVADDSGDGDEGVVAALLHPGEWFPLIAADQGRVDSLRQLAQVVASKSNKTVRLLRFTTREELEVINP